MPHNMHEIHPEHPLSEPQIPRSGKSAIRPSGGPTFRAAFGLLSERRAQKLLFFSIPYDQGWSATVDGTAAQLRLINIGFMGLPLDSGNHEIELQFTPPLRKPGAFVSLAGLATHGFLLLAARTPRQAERVHAREDTA